MLTSLIFRNLDITCVTRLPFTCGIKFLSSCTESNFFDFCGPWPKDEKQKFLEEMKILPDFLTAEEENKIFEEINPYLTRLRYESDHWDDAIHGFRETERKNWYPHNRLVIQRISDIGFNGKIMPYIHVLDLEEKGVIKPHIDSTRYCGHTIAGLSLLSDSIMRLVRANQDSDENKQNNENSAYRYQQNTPLTSNDFYADILLPRRSLYIMSHSARYKFTHEILSKDQSIFMGAKIDKQRRISIICRNDP